MNNENLYENENKNNKVCQREERIAIKQQVLAWIFWKSNYQNMKINSGVKMNNENEN